MNRLKYDLSIIISSYKMERELPRTIESCLPPFQSDADDYLIEILVLNNDDTISIAKEDLPKGVTRVINSKRNSGSPVKLMNIGIRKAKSRNLLLIFDGARMLSPRVVSNTINVLSKGPYALSTPLAYHLGKKHQSISTKEGYNVFNEDELLAKIDWQRNGNRLFEISSLADSNRDGHFEDINESCAFGISRKFVRKLGGYESKFTSVGGGFATLDLFKRAVEHNKTELFVMLDAGSFHQLHGGISASPNAPFEIWAEEYRAITGNTYSLPKVNPQFIGSRLIN